METSVDSGCKLGDNDKLIFNVSQFQRLVEGLIYLCNHLPRYFLYYSIEHACS